MVVTYVKQKNRETAGSAEKEPISLSRLKINSPTEYSFAEITESNFGQAMAIIKACFPLEADRVDAANELSRYHKRDLNFYSDYLGVKIELVSYKMFYKHNTPVAIGGLYKVEGDPTRAYLGWFGVAPDFRGKVEGSSTTIAHSVVKYLKTLAKSLGCTSLAALAEDAKENIATQKFYKRAGFTIDRKFIRLGEADRMYECKLGRDHPCET